MNRPLLSLAAILLLLPLPAAAATLPDDGGRGLEIAREADRRDQGWGDSESVMRMILRNAHGDSSERKIRTRALEVQGDGDKSLTIFDEPRDVQGTAFLTFSHALEPDDQWIFLPALKRVKRISSRNKSGPFMGSEFAYEDMASFEVEKYSYRYLRDEPCGELTCFVVESYPQDKNSGYTRLLTWIDQAEYRTQRIDYFDRKGAPLKTLTLADYQQYLDRYWRPHRLEMVNHQSGKSTSLLFDQIRFNTGLSDDDFNKNSLKRVK
ncbi:outer membrane lipoprotein-sorting protein [Motiliproteus sediminis]|uniref:outer membrane lipoprotein-sorting protein n=1 Tax=Motiliproteus sediminis TaxID=1468178 RepID=UPI001AEF9CD6|nr:outer membrane lipoprotein-sorting protein [Motiliproteus sediminis]